MDFDDVRFASQAEHRVWKGPRRISFFWTRQHRWTEEAWPNLLEWMKVYRDHGGLPNMRVHDVSPDDIFTSHVGKSIRMMFDVADKMKICSWTEVEGVFGTMKHVFDHLHSKDIYQ